MNKQPMRVFAFCCMITVSLCFVVGGLVLTTSDKDTTKRDYIEYWAAGQQLVHGANPYDVTAALQLERAVGLEGEHPRVTWSPPAAFVLLLPLGFVSAKTGSILWSLALLASLSISIWVIWILNGRPYNRFHLLGYMFGPVVVCLMAGQLGIFLLLALVLFLYFHRSQPFFAGAVLLPCAMKPHLFVPFAIVVLLWVVHRKAYRVLTGFFTTLLASCALVLCVSMHVFSQYFQMMHSEQAVHMYAPTLSSVLRYFIDRNAVWPQFLPEAIACVWAASFFWTRRSLWSWMDQGLLLLLVSAAVTPYGFLSDESMLLPAVLSGLYRARESGRSLLPLGLIAGAALIEVFPAQLYSMLFLWTVPAWLAWYVYATRSNGEHKRVVLAAAKAE
jgi:hypothetical protein